MRALGAAFLAVSALACVAPRAATQPPSTVDPRAPLTLPPEKAAEAHKSAIDTFVEHDRAGDWNEGTCAAVAKAFDDIAEKGALVAEASFNAGLAFQRCNDDANAKARFERAVKADAKNPHARAQLALYRYKSDGDENAAILVLESAVIDAKFQDVPALVALATVQMARDGAVAGRDCANDVECAKTNLQRALAIDDAYMPALNQLALYYFQQARKRAGVAAAASKARGRHVLTPAGARRAADVQQLELAALVCSQAIKKNARYAPIHNTAGLVQNELGHVSSAVAEFGEAIKLDPRSFEAQMNYAAVNLGFRGFEQAQKAYEAAITLRPNDYDAHLGLAIALRGPLTGAEPEVEKRVSAVLVEIEAAKKIDPSRPDAYFNQAILVHEFETKGGDQKRTLAALDKAKASFLDFLTKAGERAEYAAASTRAKERIQDIDQTRIFVAQSGGVPTKPSPVATPP
jgi:tetratricopeptide (TPR) repeat protein